MGVASGVCTIFIITEIFTFFHLNLGDHLVVICTLFLYFVAVWFGHLQPIASIGQLCGLGPRLLYNGSEDVQGRD